MHIASVSAITLKNNVSNILNEVYFNKRTTVIKRYGEIIAKIVPVDKKNKDVRSVLDKYFGALPDFTLVSKRRNFKKRTANF